MKMMRLCIVFLLWVGVSTAYSKENSIRLVLCVSEYKPGTGEVKLQLIIVNSSVAVQDLSKAGKLEIESKAGLPINRVPERFLGVTRWLDPDIAALKLQPHKWVSQEFSLRPDLSRETITEVRARLEIGSTTYESNTIYFKTARAK
jgi:hypothetical protein